MADGANGVSGQLAIPPVAGEPNCACVNAMIQNLKMADSTAPEALLIQRNVTQLLVVVSVQIICFLR